MFRNIDQRNISIIIDQCIIIIIVKEVHQSLNETMRLFDESVEEHILLLTFSWWFSVAMDTLVNKWETLIGWVEILVSSNLATKLLTANELIFAEYC